MKKKSLLDVAVLATVFAIFLTSSFDLIGSIKVMGFTIRTVYLFVLFGAGLTLYRWIKQKELILPEGFSFLAIWTIMMLAFIPNSPLVIRNVGYGVWLLLNVSTIFFVVNFMNRANMKDFIRLYLLSFFALSLLGIVQYITPQIGLQPIEVGQWWVPNVLPRVNAFTYEPSFFATYLLFGIPAMLILLARGKLMGIPQWLFYTMLAVDVTALMVCSSRMGILIFLVFLAGFMAYVIVRWIRERRLGLHLAMSFAVPLFVAASVLMIMDIRLRQVKKDVGYALYLNDTGWMEKDITKGNSFKIRIQAMEKTFEVFQKNPVIGVSLGGIAPWIANTHLTNITSNDQVKPFEGINVPLEVLAASGVFGFVVFCIYLFQLCRPLLKKLPDGGDKDYYIALFWGFALGFIMLVENQNILRPYVWAHLALMAGVIRVLGRQSTQEKKGIAMANNYRKWSGTRRLTELVKHVVEGHPKIALAGLHMRALTILVLMVLCAVPLFAQTVLINPAAEGGFENGPSFADNGWTVVNDVANSWRVGTATKNGGLRGAYISDDLGYSNYYNFNFNQVSHFYRDVDFPLGQTMIVLRFYFKERATFNFYAAMKVFLVSTETTPVAGVPLSSGAIWQSPFSDYDGTYDAYEVVIPISAAGTTKRLVFSWRNFSGFDSNPPAAIDNIELVSEGSVTSNGTGGGNLSDVATLIGGILGSGVNLVVRTGDALVIDQDATVKNLALEQGASVHFDPVANRRLTVEKDLIVSNGAALTSNATGTANHDLVIGRNLVNDGTLDLSTNGGAAGAKIEFNGTGDQRLSGSGITDITFITINTASSTATVLIEPVNFTVKNLNTNATGPVDLIRGTLIMGGSFPLETVLFTTASPTIPSTSGLILKNPNLKVLGQNGTTTVGGTLRVSNGTFNVGFDDDDCIVLLPNSTFISEGGAVNVTAALGVSSPSNPVKVALTGGTITVQTVGNSSTTFAGLDFGFSSSTTATSTATTIVIQKANTAASGPGDYRVPFGLNITGGTLQLGNATTSAASTFRIRGDVTNLVIDPTFNHTVQLTAGGARFTSSTTIPTGATLGLNGNTLTLMRDLNITGGATLNGTATSSALTFNGTVPQTFTNNGTLVDGHVRSLVINNSSGATPAVAINNSLAVSNSLFLTFGSLGGSGTVTLGNSAASSTMTLTRVNGSILSQPIFGPGVTFNATYNNSQVQTVTGPELPSIVTGTLTINDPAGVLLNATTTAQKLTLTNGTLTTATSTALIISGTNPTDVTGGSSTSYVKGPLIRSLPPSLASGTEYPFPIGKNSYNPVSIVDAVTNAGGTTKVRADAFEGVAGGTPGTGIGEIDQTNIWGVGPTTLEELFIDAFKVRFYDRSNLGGGSRIGKSQTASGTYNSIGGNVSGNAIISDVNTSFSYFAIGLNTNTFSGTYTVGSSGANYTTLTAAINAMKAGGFTGPVVLSLLDATYSSETFPIVLSQIAGASATNTLTIKPASSNVVTISGASTSGIFKLDGADYVTIDGSNNGTSSRDLSITNTGFDGPVIWLSSQGSVLGARNNTIKNLILTGGLSQVSTNTGGYGILGSGTSPTLSSDGADNDNNTIQNNYVKKIRWGILFRGASTNPNDGNSITSNLVGPPAFGDDQIGKSGIVVQHQSGVTISNNEVRTVGAVYPQINDAASEDRIGIGLGGDNWTPISTTVTNATVTGNIVHDIIDERTRSAVGILVAGVGTPSNNVIANNIIYNVRSNGTSGEQGVGIGIFTGNGDKVVFNSIRMEGDIDTVGSTTGTGSNVGIRVNSGSNLTIKNNIVSVDLTSNTGTLNHYAVVAPTGYFWGTGGLDYNIYYVNTSNTQMKLGGIGFTIPYTPYADLTSWKTNLLGTQDANSKSFAPDFTSATDLHLNLSSVNANYIALPIAGVTTDIDGQTRSTTAPYKGADENIVYLLPDLIAPAAPLTVAVVDSGNTTVTLRWRKNSESDFLRYRIYSGTSANPTSKADSTTGGVGDTSKTVSSLTNGTRYYFRVTAVDNAQNESGFSNEVNAKPGDYVPPAVPQNLVATDSSSGSITVKWRKNTEADFLHYRIYRNTSPGATTRVDSTSGGVSDTSKTFSGLVNGTRYYLRITAVDSAGNESAYSNEVSASPAGGNAAPAAPLSLAVTDSSSTTITIKWRKNNEADFLRYRIYRSTAPSPATKVDSTAAGISDTSKTFAGLTNGTRYYFRVTAVDSAGSESAYSNEVDAMPADRNAPSAPLSLVVTDSSSTTITIKWRKNNEADFLRYRIYRSVVPSPTTKVDSTTAGASDTSKTFAGLSNGTRYYLRVTAIDSAGNESAYSNEVDAAPADRVAPAAPLNLVVVDSSTTKIGIKWRRNTDADFLRYRIYRGTSVGPTTMVDSTTSGATDTSKTFTGLTNGTRYYLRVTAVDSAGNESAYSNEVSATPADRIAPSAPISLALTDSSSGKIGIKWRKNTDGDFLRYRIYRATSPNAATRVDSTAAGAGDTSKTFTGLTNGTRYYLRVTAVDTSGNESAYSNEVNGAPNAALAVDDLNSQIPKEYSLSQNYPNPFNPSTVIRYGLPTRSRVKLEIYNILGQSIALLADEEQDARFYEMKWQAPVSSGLYFYRLQAVSADDPNKSFVQVRKMLLLK